MLEKIERFKVVLLKLSQLLFINIIINDAFFIVLTNSFSLLHHHHNIFQQLLILLKLPLTFNLAIPQITVHYFFHRSNYSLSQSVLCHIQIIDDQSIDLVPQPFASKIHNHQRQLQIIVFDYWLILHQLFYCFLWHCWNITFKVAQHLFQCTWKIYLSF